MVRLGRYPWKIPAVVLLATCVVSAMVPVLTWAQDEVQFVAEPGLLATDGTWVLPVSVSRARPAGDLDISVVTAWLEDRPLVIRERLVYSLKGGGGSTALVMVLDTPPLDGPVATAWSDVITQALDRSAWPGLWFTLTSSGPEPAAVPPPGESPLVAEDVRQMLVGPAPGRLWDTVVEALSALDAPDLPERRVVLLISDGREEIPSQLVMASCVEAALRARVAVYALSLAAGAESAADGARLRELVRRTGGQIWTLGADPEQDLGRMLDLIGSAWGVRLAAADVDLPAEITLRRDDDLDFGLVGQIAERQSLRSPRGKPWALIGLALLVAAGAGYLLWGQRNVEIGDLMITTKNGVRRFPIPRHGVTIGRDPDNSLVLANPLVSGHHAVIRVKDGEVILTDLRSSRGTKVNGGAIRTSPLQRGDRIQLGGAIELVFRDQAPGT